MKKIKNKSAVFLGCIFLVVLGLMGYKFFHNNKVLGPEKTIIVSVKENQTPTDIFNQLVKENVRPSFNQLYDEFVKRDAKLYVNDYEVTNHMSASEIVSILNSPQSNINGEKLVVIEGDQIENVAQKLADLSEGRFTKEDILNYWDSEETLNQLINEYWFLTDEVKKSGIIHPLEGYLAPATYTVTSDFTLEDMTKKMLDAMELNLSPYQDSKARNDLSVHEFLALASIVEREVIHEADRAPVAGVFYNRLEQNMPLQSDITVLYALGEHKEIVTYADLEVDSPYNTYKNTGIPIGPIASVSSGVLAATANPEDNDYLYFFALQDTGEVIYSKTLEEHEKVSEEHAWE